VAMTDYKTIQFCLAFLLLGFVCCRRICCWTFLMWEILLLDFLMWEILLLDFSDVGDSAAGLFSSWTNEAE
jgi:hypothetical protein